MFDVVAALVEPDQVGADVAAAVDAPLADPLRQLRNHQIVAVELLRLEREVDVLALKPERSEEHTSELQSRPHLVCRPLVEKKKVNQARGPLPLAQLAD